MSLWVISGCLLAFLLALYYLLQTDPPSSVRLPAKELRIVLVGKTGVGKSTTGNSILRSGNFVSKMSSRSTTQMCEKGEVIRRGRKIVVVDTPGFFDTTLPPTEIAEEVKKCVSFTHPGPHVIIQVLRPGAFSREEQQVAEIIRGIFSLKAKAYLIMLFTRKSDLPGGSLGQFLQNADEMLVDQIAQCGNRFLAFDNKARGREQEVQIDELIQLIDNLVKRNRALGAPHYTKDMLEQDQRNRSCVIL
ncbi:GTPase IMAP family member 4-like isoform X3 [Python bivittatus]|uniref:GTPase IMAP family member 4-like isoform X3 n=1 Tax=Python bivittatus TaxID=176946 RepID=A0A9F5N0Q4_PYTBI|nr:GTPase IMAP family member 4-like isoform X3 [Python bivittatus]